MKIGIDIRKYYDYGIGTYIQNLLTEMLAQSNDEFVYFTFPEHIELIQRELCGTCVTESAKLYSLKELFSLSHKVNAAKVNVFHAPHYTLPYRLAMPSVVTIHDIIHLKFKEYFSVAQRTYAQFVIGHACKSATAILVNSEFTKNELVNWFDIDPIKIVVTYPGVNPQFYQRVSEDEKNNFQKKYQLRKPYILYVGSMKSYKNIKILLETFEDIRKSADVELVFVGETIEKNLEFASVLEKSSYRDSVKQLGKIAQAELLSAYQNASMVVLPSVYEGFGSPMVEAMASGVPAIGARGTAITEIVGEGGLLFDPYDKLELVKKIELVLSNADARSKLIERGYQQVNKFSYARCAQQTLEVYWRIAQ
jgi:glycosyltransferase involved in cell wall biosynthesis